jgi:hypothetical protein
VAPLSPRARLVTQFLFAFACVFGGLALPLPGIAPVFVRAHAALGNELVEGRMFERGIALHFDAPDADAAKRPWQLTLRISDPRRSEAVLVPIDLRTLVFLPIAAFIGLALAAPLHSAWRNVRVLALGLLILEPTLLVLTALPLLSFLGGIGPVQAFRLSAATHVLLQILYRALVAPPGMTYALPLFLWWALVARQAQSSEVPVKLPGV